MTSPQRLQHVPAPPETQDVRTAANPGNATVLTWSPFVAQTTPQSGSGSWGVNGSALAAQVAGEGPQDPREADDS